MRLEMTPSTTPVVAVCLDASRAAGYASAAAIWFVVDTTTRRDHLKARGPGGTS